MARKRGVTDASGAFELFLDTISNTFGGVLFVALLVCILLQLSGTASETADRVMDPVRARLLQNKLKDLGNRIASLKGIQKRQVREIESLVVSQPDKDLAMRYSRLTAEEQRELGGLLKKTGEAASLNDEVAVLEQLVVSLRRKRTELEKRLTQIRTKAAQRQPQRIRLPRFQDTTKQEVAIAVRGGRMIFVFQYDGQGKRLGPNWTDIEVAPGRKGLRPKAGHGLIIEDTPLFRERLAQRLENFDKSVHYFAVAVWPDSYKQCDVLRDQLIRMGFSYNLLLIERGGGVLLQGGKGGVQG